MASPFDHCFDREASFSRHLEHQKKAVLGKRKSSGSLKIVSLFFLPSVWGMIGRKNGNGSVGHRLADRRPVIRRLDCGVALDEGA